MFLLERVAACKDHTVRRNHRIDQFQLASPTHTNCSHRNVTPLQHHASSIWKSQCLSHHSNSLQADCCIASLHTSNYIITPHSRLATSSVICHMSHTASYGMNQGFWHLRGSTWCEDAYMSLRHGCTSAQSGRAGCTPETDWSRVGVALSCGRWQHSS